MRYGLVACFFALSLLSKPMLVTLPFVLLLLDVWPLRRFWIEGRTLQSTRIQIHGSLFLEKLPLLAMSAASSVVTFKAQHAAGAVAPIDVLPLSQRLANAIVAYVGYLSKAFWPVDLAVIYPLPDQIIGCENGAGDPGDRGNHDWRGRADPQAALAGGGMVLVFGNAGSSDWFGASGRISPWRIVTPMCR